VMGLSIRFGCYRSIRRPWPLVHRPWSLLTIVTMRISSEDIDSIWTWIGRYPGRISGSIRFWNGREWEIRIKPSQFHTRFTVRVRGEDCSICGLIYPFWRKRWAELSGILTYPDPGRLQRRLLRRRDLSESGLQRSGSNRFCPVFLAQGGGAKRFPARGRETNCSVVLFLTVSVILMNYRS